MLTQKGPGAVLRHPSGRPKAA